jgi:hypothetical protein
VKTFSEFLETDEGAISEVTLKPSTARTFALMLTIRIQGHRKRVRSAIGVGEKIDHLSDLISDAAYMSLLGVAIEQGDQSLLRKIRK